MSFPLSFRENAGMLRLYIATEVVARTFRFRNRVAQQTFSLYVVFPLPQGEG